jgi:uncharacterized protein
MSIPAYDPRSDVLPLDDQELADLDQLLSGLKSDAAMNVEALDGYLTALLLSPQPLAELPGDAWLPLIWGGDEADTVFASGKQRKKLQLLVLRHLRALDAQIGSAAWQPLFSVAGDGNQEWVDAEDWCTGFMIGVDLAGDAWASRFESGEEAALLAPIALLGGDESQQDPQALAELADPGVRDAMSREVHSGVSALRALVAGKPR